VILLLLLVCMSLTIIGLPRNSVFIRRVWLRQVAIQFCQGTGFDNMGHHLGLTISFCRHRSVPVPCENDSAETTVAEGGRNPVAGLWQQYCPSTANRPANCNIEDVEMPTSKTVLPVRRLRAENSSSIEPAHAVHVSLSLPVLDISCFTP